MALRIQVKNLETGELREQIFGMGPILLGRSKICDLSLNDSVLSRQHASLTILSESQIELEDLKSANGTFVKGQRVTKQRLAQGESFNLGQHEIKILGIELKKEVSSEDHTPAQSVITLVPEPSVAREPSMKAQVPVPEELTLKTPVFLKEAPSKSHLQTKDWVQVSLLWKGELVDLQCFDRGEIVTIGEDTSNDFSISLTSLPNIFQFLKILPTGMEVQLHSSMKGLVETKDQVIDLEDLKKNARQTALGLSTHVAFNDRCLIEVGPFAFFIKSTKLSLTAPLTAPLVKDKLYFSILAASILFMVLFLNGIHGLPSPKEALPGTTPENIVSLAPPTEAPQVSPSPSLVPPPPKETKLGEKQSVKTELSGQQGEGAKASGDQGKAGRTTGNVAARARPIGMVTNSNTQLKSIPRGSFGKESDPRLAKAGKSPDQGVGSGTPKPRGTGGQAPSKEIKPNVKVEDLGISGVLSSRSGGGGRGATGGAMEGAGLGGELEGSLEGLERGSDINNRGSGGRGAKGIGLGGGGSSLDVGGLSTKGKGGGQSGFGLGSSGNKGDADVSYSAEDIEVRDGLTREEIERVVKANQDSIEKCYEQALIQAGTALGGRLKIGWFVNRNGNAENIIQQSGISGGDSLFRCIASKISTWQFPKPRGGSGAQVSWPWVFRKGS